MLGMFALSAHQAQAADDCEQLQRELEANKHNILKKIKIKKKLKHCQPTVAQTGQGINVQPQAIQAASTTNIPQTQSIPQPPATQTVNTASSRACDLEFQKVLSASTKLPAAPGFKTESLYEKTFAALSEHRTTFSPGRNAQTIGRPIQVVDHGAACSSWEGKRRALDRISRDVISAVPSWVAPGVSYWQERNNYATQLHQFTLCALRYSCAANGLTDVSSLTWESGRPAPPPPQEYVRPPGHIPMGGPGGFARPGVDPQEAARERAERERQHRENKKWYEETIRKRQAEKEAKQRQADAAARQRQGGGNTSPRPVARPDLYGALAIDYAQGRAYGWALNARSQAEANQYALNHCNGSTSGQCQVVMQFRNTCASYAIDNTSGSTAYGWAWGPVQSNVDATALSYCRQRGGPSNRCMLRIWGCTSH